VFNKALERIQSDPRVSVRLGSPITGYGSEGRSRSARGHIRHREYHGPDNMKHMGVQFLVRGPSGTVQIIINMLMPVN
jgi:import inner membrane translocase subunit TIM21